MDDVVFSVSGDLIDEKLNFLKNKVNFSTVLERLICNVSNHAHIFICQDKVGKLCY